MKIISIFLITGLSFTSISQTDHFQGVFGINVGGASYMTSEIGTLPEFYDNQSWNSGGVTHNTVFAPTAKNYKCITGLFHIGVSVPFLKVKRISFGVQPTFGIGFFKSFASNVESDVYSGSEDPRISSLAMDATGLLYVRCKLWENWHVSLNGGYRLVRSYFNYGTPAFGFEVGQERWKMAAYAYFTTIQYNMELSNGTLQPVKLFKDFGSISVSYCLGKKPKDLNSKD